MGGERSHHCAILASDILCIKSPGVREICANALLCGSLSCQSLGFFVEAGYSTEPVTEKVEPKETERFSLICPT